MKPLIAIVIFAVSVGVLSTTFGQVPERFMGTWVVNPGDTAKSIAADPDMHPENKPQWTERWLTSGAEVKITGSTISFRHLEGGTIDLSVTLEEDLEDHTLLSAVILDPSRTEGMKASIELRLAEEGELNLRIRETNDFDLIIWQRIDDTAKESGVSAPGNAIEYLDSLTDCEPGDFRFSYTGFGTYRNTILGRTGDRCSVLSENRQIQITCNYSATTIELLTSEMKYEEARTGILSGSTDSEESKRMAEECRPN